MPFSATLCHPSTHVRDPLDLGQAGRGGLMGLSFVCFQIISGPSQAGKTTICRNIILNRDQLFATKFQRVIWCYSERSSLPEDLIASGHIDEVIQGYKDYDTFRELVEPYAASTGSLLIFDDAVSYLHKDFARIWREGSHHLKVTSRILCKRSGNANNSL